uniref:Uncharacterized protein n=1 Tax=Rhizophora mucronata TaxID=61149 RepID=A0A2P2IMV2_RHIMU
MIQAQNQANCVLLLWPQPCFYTGWQFLHQMAALRI